MYASSPAFNKAACRSAYTIYRIPVFLRRPGCDMSSASSTDSSIPMQDAHSAISSTSASLPWVLNPVVNGVWILSLLSISLRHDTDFQLELIRYLNLFSQRPSRLKARSSSCTIPATCATCAWRYLQGPPLICAARCFNFHSKIRRGSWRTITAC